MNRNLVCLAALMALIVGGCSRTPLKEKDLAGDAGVAMWLTTGDKTSLLARRMLSFEKVAEDVSTVVVDAGEVFQTIDGFGYSLTGGSAMLMHTRLDAQERNALLKELFSAEGEGIGVSYLRVSIGASDLDDHVFFYVGSSSDDLNEFSLDKDRRHLIPILKEILAINPSIKIMGSPWSAPAWMKTNGKAKGGSLKPGYYALYAEYFVKYVQGMRNEGIRIDAVTLQNEPENPHNTPSMLMTAEDQVNFVKDHLGPAFARVGIDTKIVVFDHNCDHPEYPIKVLNDSAARKYIDGSAFHLYLGEIDAMSKVHEAHPDKNLYFTEQWTSGEGNFSDDLMWHSKQLIVGATRNWARNVLEWNLAADPHFDPHTDDGGCTTCQGALTIGEEVERNVSYYIIAHASKFVPDGSVRIGSTIIEGLSNVAFMTPEGKKVLIAVNDTDSERSISVREGEKQFVSAMPARSLATYVW